MNKKEIHFYADVVGISFNKITSMTHVGFLKEISRKEKEIHTRSMIDLSFDWTKKEFGEYRIFIHQNKKCIEVYPDMSIPITEKHVRSHHNLKNLWLGGAFDAYFYGDRDNLNNTIKNHEEGLIIIKKL